MKRLAAPILLIVTLAACGGSSANADDPATDDTATTSAAGSGAGSEEAFAAYDECLTEQGVNVDALPQRGFGRPGGTPPAQGQAPPAPGEGGPAMDLDEATMAALEECRSLLGEGGPGFGGGPGGGDPAAFEEQFAALTDCLRAEGIEIPETQAGPDQQGGPFGVFGNLDMEDPAVQSAMEACGDLLPGPGGGNGPMDGTPGGDG